MSGMKQQQVPCASGCSSPKRRSVFHQPFRVVAAVAALAACLPAFAAQSSALASTASPIDKLSGSGFLQAFSLIFVSEIGDKTFFIAGLLAMRSSKVLAFVGSLAALAVMTIISVVIGQIFHAVPSSISRGIPFDDYLAVAAFAFFGVKTLKQAYEMQDEGAGMEVEKAEAEREVDGLGSGKVVKLKTSWYSFALTCVIQALTCLISPGPFLCKHSLWSSPLRLETDHSCRQSR
jgi:putative Ca2+/H+ antiporter (TMEM165/GDT1 family)